MYFVFLNFNDNKCITLMPDVKFNVLYVFESQVLWQPELMGAVKVNVCIAQVL